MRQVPRSIFIVGGDADGNLGDRGILQSTCEQLRSLAPELAVTVISARPGSESYPGATTIPPSLPAICRAARRADLVLIGGGGLFQDDDSLVKMPYWAALTALLRTLCPRVVGHSLGVGPLGAASSRFAARAAFACMERISVRDPEAQRIARKLTRKPVELVPDPALLVRPVPAAEARSLLGRHGVPLDTQPLIGVAPRRWFPSRPRIIPHRWTARLRRGDPALTRDSAHLASLLARVLDEAAARHEAFILFLPTYTLSHEADDVVCEQIRSRMSSPDSAIVRIDAPPLYKAVAAQLALMLGGRMHPTIFATSSTIPAVGLAYNRKFSGFFELLGQTDLVMDVRDFVDGELTAELGAMIDTAWRKQFTLRARIDVLAASLRQFYGSLLERGA